MQAEDAGGVVQKVLPCTGEHRGASATVQKGAIEAGLQPLHLVADGGLGQPKRLCRAGDAPVLLDGAQSAQGVDVKAAGLGDCIDCGICVQVCPTGIDIRNGLQYECIACAACIDACDTVMEKVGYPPGLIRYSTENAMSKHYAPRDILGHLARPRTILYTSVLLAIIVATIWSLAVRIPLKVDILRDRTTLYREADDGRIENVYTFHIINTDERAHRYALEVTGVDGIQINGDQVLEVPATSNKKSLVVASVEDGVASQGSHPIFFDVRALSDDKIAVHEKTAFFMP